MLNKLALVALSLLLMPALALAGSIYASTPTTSPVRGTISPSGFVNTLNTGTTTFTVEWWWAKEWSVTLYPRAS